MTHPRSIAAALLLALVIAGSGGPAQADDSEPSPAQVKAAKKHHARAKKLFSFGHFDRALVEYEAAYAAVPVADLMFNIGQCHRHLKDYKRAIFAFRKYLYDSPDATDRADVEELIKELERLRDIEEAESRDIDPMSTPTARPARKPFYKKWWFIAGTVAVVGTATVAVIAAGDDYPSSDLGLLDFSK